MAEIFVRQLLRLQKFEAFYMDFAHSSMNNQNTDIFIKFASINWEWGAQHDRGIFFFIIISFLLIVFKKNVENSSKSKKMGYSVHETLHGKIFCVYSSATVRQDIRVESTSLKDTVKWTNKNPRILIYCYLYLLLLFLLLIACNRYTNTLDMCILNVFAYICVSVCPHVLEHCNVSCK